MLIGKPRVDEFTSLTPYDYFQINIEKYFQQMWNICDDDEFSSATDQLEELSIKTDVKDFKRGRDNRKRREEVLASHEISIQSIKHKNPKQLLGSGGFGLVFLVEHDMTEKAMKVVDLTGLSRKIREKHPKHRKNNTGVFVTVTQRILEKFGFSSETR